MGVSSTPYTITYSYGGDANYLPASDGSTTLTVTKAPSTPTITWSNPANITYGTMLSTRNSTPLNSTIPGTLTYKPAAGTLLGVGSSQELTVTFTPTDSADYMTATKTVAINVLAAQPTLSPLTSLQSITYGTPSIILAGAFLTTAPIPAGETVTVTIGSATSTATIQPDDSFSAVVDTQRRTPPSRRTRSPTVMAATRISCRPATARPR